MLIKIPDGKGLNHHHRVDVREIVAIRHWEVRGGFPEKSVFYLRGNTRGFSSTLTPKELNHFIKEEMGS